jgi:ABC-type phosphate transport system substrate-binding protein
MTQKGSPMRWTRLRLAVVAVTVLGAGSVGMPAEAAGFVPLNGDGSSWAEPAISQWARDVTPQGIQVSFSGDGSAQGRQNYIQGIDDFAASDIAFLTSSDPFGGGIERPQVAYSYIPIVAGGTTFMYNLVVGGRKVTNLRLSGDTITKIFTGQITNWDDARITHDYGAKLPNQRITVVTRDDGSGATYQFTRWMAKEFTSQWNTFCSAHGGPKACPPTEFYPSFNGAVQKNGSDQVASFIASNVGDGAIGYDEYAYALNDHVPAVKLLNKAGYYSLPSASNVAIALQKAQIDENPNSLTFLIQNLDNVYTNSDPRAYPLSSYSYLIVPRKSRPGFSGPPPSFTTTKGNTLSTWLNYVLCGAQQKAGNLGYSPLPKNLVVGGFNQDKQIPGAVPTPNLSNLNNCNNPTYHNGVNLLIKTAPQPSPCDKVTAPLNCSLVHGNAVSNTSSSGNRVTTGAGSANPTSGDGGGGGPAGSATSSAPRVDPNTGQVLGDAQAVDNAALAQSVSLAARPEQRWLLSSLTALEIVGAVIAPALLGAWWARRRKRA